jgi:ABC-type glutathione transport system ATPase component
VRDAALVILDEPTAALDATAEYQLFARFRDVVAGKTALVISHRFSTVRMADQILVLEAGRIVEAGSHAELVALGGRYATLYEMQVARYRENPGAHYATTAGYNHRWTIMVLQGLARQMIRSETPSTGLLVSYNSLLY